MGILNKITEEYFGESARKEDEINFNTNELKPVDMGGTVLWADRNLRATNTEFEEHFSFKELYEYGFKFGEGWRLPTWWEYRELFEKNVTREINSDMRFKFNGVAKFESEKTREKLKFYEIGFYLEAGGERKSKRSYGCGPVFTMWTKDIYGNVDDAEKYGYMLVYTFDPGRDEKKRNHFAHWEQFYPVRLVKDKK